MKLRIIAAALLAIGCSVETFIAPDSGTKPDVIETPDAQPIDAPADDASEDAPEAATDASVDAPAPPDTGTPDTGIDAGADSGFDAGKDAGGDYCPLIGTCSGYSFHVDQPDSGISYPCASVTPNCPTNWKCWGYDKYSVFRTGKCP